MLMNIPTPAPPHSPLCLCVLPLTVCFFCHEKGSGTRWGTSLFFFLKLGQLIQQCSLSGTISLKNPPTPPRHIIKRFSHKHDPSNIQAKCLHVQSAAHTLHWVKIYVCVFKISNLISIPPLTASSSRSLPLFVFCFFLCQLSLWEVLCERICHLVMVYSVVHLTDKLKKGHFLLQTVMYKVFDMNVNSMIKKTPKQTAVFSSSIVTLFPSCRIWRECR